MDSLPLDYIPELRPHPPWLMEEMVAIEPSLGREILLDREAASAIATRVREAVAARQPIAAVGCGTSETAAIAVADLLRDAVSRAAGGRGLIEARQAFEAALDPWSGGLCIGISHEGGTRATGLALDAAKSVGAATALITARPAGAAAKHAEHLFITPRIDRAWCHTVGYLSPILAGAAIGEALCPSGLEGAALERYLGEGLNLRSTTTDVARTLGKLDRLIVIGAGADRSPAQELALKIEEGVRLPTRMLELETLLHGHLAACDGSTGLIAIATDGGRTLKRTELALRAARRIGVQVGAIVSADVDETLDPAVTNAGRAVLPDSGERLGLIGRIAGAAVALQLLTLELAGVRGTNPDLIRREQAPYREAAKIAEADSSW